MRPGRPVLYFPVNSAPRGADASGTVARRAGAVQLAACIFLLIPRRAAPRLSEVVARRGGVFDQIEACIFLLFRGAQAMGGAQPMGARWAALLLRCTNSL